MKGWSKCQQCAPLSLHLHLPRLSSSQLPPSYPEEYHKRPGICSSSAHSPAACHSYPVPFHKDGSCREVTVPTSQRHRRRAPLTPLASKRVGIGVKGPWGKRGAWPSFPWAHSTHGDNLFLQPGSPACQERIQSVGYKPIATM